VLINGVSREEPSRILVSTVLELVRWLDCLLNFLSADEQTFAICLGTHQVCGSWYRQQAQHLCQEGCLSDTWQALCIQRKRSTYSKRLFDSAVISYVFALRTFSINHYLNIIQFVITILL